MFNHKFKANLFNWLKNKPHLRNQWYISDIRYMYNGTYPIYVQWYISDICTMVHIRYMYNGTHKISDICTMVHIRYMYNGTQKIVSDQECKKYSLSPYLISN